MCGVLLISLLRVTLSMCELCVGVTASQIRLVVLSACESLQCGDAFVRAGVPHVIAFSGKVCPPCDCS